MGKRPAKSETLTIRLDPKARFMLEFVSRLRGQTITTVVERAIKETADRAVIERESYGQRGSYTDTWRDYWSVSEGERALKMATEDQVHPTFEEERRYAFAKEHWPFFWGTKDRGGFVQHYVDVLWPRIDEFIAIHDETKTTDYFAAGKAMQKALINAKLVSPDWPVKNAQRNNELPDEIPF